MMRSWRLSAAILLVLASVGATSQPAAYPVQRIIDGDTVVLQTIGTVRLIGVDTPETVDPREPVQRFGRESAAFLRRILDGQSVRVEYDQQRVDKYRRTLAYLYLADGTFVNLEIVRQGYGHAYLDYPFGRMDLFRAAEREARDAGRGLWADAPAAEQQTPSAEPSRVWVNTASKVYHCPGTRYYGNTARGNYMTETEARENGYRAAYGRSCGPIVTPGTSTRAADAPSGAPIAQSRVTATTDTKVWVNLSSKVYHCPGTRYYGDTARGEYMAESEATGQGHRPAGGRRCGPLTSAVLPTATPARAVGVPSQTAASAPQAAGNPDTRVWVNTSSRVYHCPGTRYYGATKSGTYLRQQDAQEAGHRPASGRYCS